MRIGIKKGQTLEGGILGLAGEPANRTAMGATTDTPAPPTITGLAGLAQNPFPYRNQVTKARVLGATFALRAASNLCHRKLFVVKRK